mgnify:CR=1 FL=1
MYQRHILTAIQISPYDEIGGIYSVHPDGTETAIIEKGRFVLPGTEKLNEAFEA